MRRAEGSWFRGEAGRLRVLGGGLRDEGWWLRGEG